VSTPDFVPPAAAEAVREALASADRRRRAREASRLLWRAAPVIAGAALAVAVARRWTGSSAWTPPAVVVIGVVALAAYIFVVTRSRALADRAAAAIDLDAGLGGELRSASWFANRQVRDEWADLHLERAAGRLSSVDWSRLYPIVRAPRARFASVLMIAGALALTFGLPQRASARRPTGTPSSEATKAVPPGPLMQPDGILLPPELMAKLQELLNAAQSGNTEAAERLASNEELRELLNRLAQDPELLAKLARALAAADPKKGPTAKELKELAERARRAADMAAMSQDMREALEKMAEEAESAEAQESASNEEGRPMSSDGPQQGETGETNAASSMQELSVQMTRQADPGGGAGIMMMSNPGEKGSGPPGAGVGGSGSDEAAAAAAAALAAAFKQEVVEASQDNPGDNIDTEVRRKSEQGSSKMGFTHGAAGQFDKSRAAAPPPVPEARRNGVQSYFIRKSQ
jgi:hypothetical protein